MEKEVKMTNVDFQVYELIEKKSYTTTQLAKDLKKLPTAISRSIRKIKKLGLAKTFQSEGKKERWHTGITKPDINKYR